MKRRRQTYLHISDFERLEDWCRMVRVIFASAPYLVGSVTMRPDFRDVDVRVILADTKFDRLSRRRSDVVRYINRAFSAWGQRETGLPIDFQLQRMTEANKDYPDGNRDPMGMRDWSQIPTSGSPSR